MREPTRTRLLSRSIALATALVLAAAACGGGESQSNASPLNEIWGEQPSQAEMRAQQLKQEEVVAACMQDEGWEYTPIDYAAQWNNEPEWIDPSTPNYGEKYGYGIVWGYRTYEWPNLDEDGNYIDGGDNSFEDPNMEYVNSLSMEENEQYYISLYGDQSQYQEPEIDDNGEEVWVAPPLEEQGCQGQAQLEVYGDQPWNDQDFNDRYSELYESLENDPAIDDAEITWSDCMYAINDDYDFYGPNDTYQYIDGKLSEAKGLETMPVDPDTGMVIGGDGTEQVYMTTVTEDGEGIGYVGQPKRLTEAEIDSLQADEIALWKADQECLDESGLGDIRRSREREMVDTLRDEFPQLIDSASGGGAG